MSTPSVGAAIGRPPEADASDEASVTRQQATGDGKPSVDAVGGGALDAPQVPTRDDAVGNT